LIENIASLDLFNAFQFSRDFDFATLTGDVSVTANVGDDTVGNFVWRKL
jgi:hypothetical protein